MQGLGGLGFSGVWCSTWVEGLGLKVLGLRTLTLNPKPFGAKGLRCRVQGLRELSFEGLPGRKGELCAALPFPREGLGFRV